ncbi:PIN domain-containing protein [bacterium]|nr:PIN domain-containing protein [bacterium]
MWLLDTVAISEPTKRSAAPPVLEWLDSQDPYTFHTSVLCLGEIRRGVERLAPGAKRTHLRKWMETELPAWFGDRVLTVDLEIAQLWGELTSNTTRTVPSVDGLIAATAIHHGLTVVTRNHRDFEALQVNVFNPWAPG